MLVRERLRKVPEQFGWVDQRLVRQEYIRRCDARGLALYLLLLTVADAQGLSYYSDEKAAMSLFAERGGSEGGTAAVAAGRLDCV